MGRREPVLLGAVEFSNKKEALEFFKDMLNRYRNNQKIDENDEVMLFELIGRHPEALQKIGCGIDHFYKAPTDKGTSCFWIKRKDGSSTDFSYISSVNAKGKTMLQEFSEACREAVRDSLEQAKDKFFEQYGDGDGKVECEITGDKIAKYESHLDHKKPMTFQVIVQTFIAANRITPAPEMMSIAQDSQFVTTFVDQGIVDAFREFHKNVAKLRIIGAKKNLSLGGSERMTKIKRPVVLD